MPRTPPTSSPPTPRHPSAGAGNVAAAGATCLIPSVFRFQMLAAAGMGAAAVGPTVTTDFEAAVAGVDVVEADG